MGVEARHIAHILLRPFGFPGLPFSFVIRVAKVCSKSSRNGSLILLTLDPAGPARRESDKAGKSPMPSPICPGISFVFSSRHSCTAAILAQGEEVGNIITLSIRYSVAIQKEKKMVWFGSSTCMPTDEKPPGGEELHRQAPAVRKEMRQLVQY